MKQNIHPDFHPVCFVDVSSGARFLTRSTMKSKQVENIDGVDYYMILRVVADNSIGNRFYKWAPKIRRFFLQSRRFLYRKFPRARKKKALKSAKKMR